MKRKCSSGDTRQLHPYIADLIDRYNLPMDRGLARQGWSTWGNVKKKKYIVDGETHWQVVSFDIITRSV